MPQRRNEWHRWWLGGLALGVGLLIPAALWLTLPPAPEIPAPPTLTPGFVRLEERDDPIPAAWEPPDLNPELEAQVATVAETLPLTETALLYALPELAPVQAYTATIAGIVRAEELNVRDGPGGAFLPLLRLPRDTQLSILTRHDGWYEVATPSGAVGWVDAGFVQSQLADIYIPQADPTRLPDPAPALVAAFAPEVASANLRSGPSLESERVQVLAEEDAPLTLLRSFEGWYEVRTAAGSQGWVAGDLVATSDFVARRVPVMTASPASLEAVRMARRYIGYEYVWGASSPRVGFDCSGLVKYVYGQLGVAFPHSAAAQWSGWKGQRVYERSALRAGDIVFFENTYKPGVSHVGIYAGDGLIIQAISESVGIRVSSLSEPYWSSRYVGAIRPFP